MRELIFSTMVIALTSSAVCAADFGVEQRPYAARSIGPVQTHLVSERVLVVDPFYTPGNPRCFLKREVVLEGGTPVLAYRPVCS